MKFKIFFLFVFSFVTSTSFAELGDLYLGKTFEVAGPNCFATALKLTGKMLSFRGVDGKEFELFTKLACQRVEVPQRGDIGVFAFPDGYAIDHAYVYLTPDWGVEKPGVDYMGKTPVDIRPMSAIIYAHGASSYCWQYAPDPSECALDHYYVRCGELDFSQWPEAQTLLEKLDMLDVMMGQFIERSSFGPIELDLLKRIEAENLKLIEANRALEPHSGTPSQVKEYFRERLRSVGLQLQFFHQKF